MGRGTARALGTAVLTLAIAAFLAPPAFATFHEILIREVYAGSAARPNSQYVELQMWAPGQNLVSGHSLAFFNAAGTMTGSVTFANNVAGAANQSTLLAATPDAESEFGITADLGLPPGRLDPAGGAVCWEAFDCVSWGSFSGALPSPAGTPAAPLGIPGGMALRRTIAPGCPTLLEPTDDTDNSAADFSAVFPSPRPNATTPAEHACSSTPGPGGGGAPQTSFRRKPAKKTHDRTPTFRFSSSESGSTYECKVDRRPFVACRSPFTAAKLSYGKHTFQVRARNGSGNVDPSPASYAFKVVKKR